MKLKYHMQKIVNNLLNYGWKIAAIQYIRLSSEQSVPSQINFLYMKNTLLNAE